MNDKSGIRFVRMSGAGNSFLIIDARQGTSSTAPHRPELVRRMCSANSGVATDGAVFLDAPKNPESSFKWDFFNSDGSKAAMCGNAARCVARLIMESESRESIKFETDAGVLSAKKALGSGSTDVEVTLPLPKIILASISGENSGQKRSGVAVDSGVPHIVLEDSRFDREEMAVWAAAVFRHHSLLGKEGANVSFYRSSGNEIEAVTWERGVEGFTRACGTGAIAVAFVLGRKEAVKIRQPGGTLTVHFTNHETHLSGPTTLGFEGEFFSEALA